MNNGMLLKTYIYTDQEDKSVIIRDSDIISADKIYKENKGNVIKSVCNVSNELSFYKRIDFIQDESFYDKFGNHVIQYKNGTRYEESLEGTYIYANGYYKLFSELEELHITDNSKDEV